MGYSEALEKQAAMLAYLRSPEARRALAEANAIMREDRGIEQALDAAYANQIKELLRAEALYVTAPICGLLAEAAPPHCAGQLL